jgi:nucleotide-binding universal stress UspA family protein
MYEHILIPTDGKEGTLEAVQPGLELASQHDATVHILHVIENDLLRQAFSLRTVRSTAIADRQHGEAAVAGLQDLAEQYEVESVTWVLRARPAIGSRRAHETIVEYAEANDIDLVVMSASDRGRLSTMLRPSLTHRVMASTDVPVFGRRLRREVPYVSDRSPQVPSGSEFGD